MGIRLSSLSARIEEFLGGLAERVLVVCHEDDSFVGPGCHRPCISPNLEVKQGHSPVKACGDGESTLVLGLWRAHSTRAAQPTGAAARASPRQ
jgi:hypothetical protein